jgi:CHAD domain-containing protein
VSDSTPGPGAVLDQRLHELVEQLHAAEQVVRAAGEEGVHDLRVAMRRIRSLLRTFRPLLDPEAVPTTERMREELKWAGAELSAVRDLEVIHGRLDEASEPEGPSSVTDRLDRHRRQAGTAARTQVEHLLASSRYERMVAELDALAEDLSWDRVTEKAARKRLRKDWRRVRRRAEAADRAGSQEEHELALHDVRKAAKRARYAAEALAPALGEPAARMATVAEQVQDTLGSHRDTLLTRGLLHRMGVEEGAPDDSEHVFALGRLHAWEQARGEESLAAYAEARTELERKKHRRWLR